MAIHSFDLTELRRLILETAPSEPDPAPPPVVEAVTVIEVATRRSAGLSARAGDALTLGAELVLSDGTTRDAVPAELLWSSDAGSITDGVLIAEREGQGTVQCQHVTGPADDIDVLVVPLPVHTAPPTPPPIPVPPPAGYVVHVDPNIELGPDVPGITHYCERQKPMPAGCGRPSATGGLTFVDDARFGRVMRLKQQPTTPITVHGRWFFPATSVAWARAWVRWPADYLSHHPGNHKIMFFDIVPGGATQRIERTGQGFTISSGVKGDPVADGTPREPDGGSSFGGPAFWPGGVFGRGWVEITMAFIREGSELWQGWWLEPEGESNVFKGSKLENVLTSLNVDGLRLPDTLNAAPSSETFLDVARIEVVSGDLDPYGLLGDLR